MRDFLDSVDSPQSSVDSPQSVCVLGVALFTPLMIPVLQNGFCGQGMIDFWEADIVEDFLAI